MVEYEYKLFYTPDKLKDISFDCIVISIMNRDISCDVIQSLIDYGIPHNKLIEICNVITKKSPFEIPLDRFVNLQQQKPFEGLLMGMSYSYYGLLINCFSKKIYKLSHFSGDIFFRYKNIEYINKFTNCLKTDIKYVIFEMPYYAFNWDASQAEK